MGCTLFLLAADGTETEVGQAWGGAHRPAYDLTLEVVQIIEAHPERLTCDCGCAPGSHATALLAAYRDGGPRGLSPDQLLAAAVQQDWPSRLPYLPDDLHLPARDRGLRTRLAILTQEIGSREDVYEAVFKDVPR